MRPPRYKDLVDLPLQINKTIQHRIATPKLAPGFSRAIQYTPQAAVGLALLRSRLIAPRGFRTITNTGHRYFSLSRAMADKKTILVFGGTGGQGGSVVKTLLSDPKMIQEWHIKTVTRDVNKPSAQALTERGVEVVTANLDDIESLRKAMKGAYAVFLVTNYWESGSADVERKQGMNVANVAKELDTQHLIFSSLLNITEISGGVYDKVLHFDSKADVEEYIRSLGIPATFFLPAIYATNFTPKMMFRPAPDPPNAWTLALPMPTNEKVIPLLWAEEDTGKFVKGILTHRDQLLGKRVLGAENYYSADEMVNIFKEVKPESGQNAVALSLPVEVFRGILGKSGMPPPAAEELSQNFEMLAQCGYYNKATFEESQAILDEPLATWKHFVETTKEFADLK